MLKLNVPISAQYVVSHIATILESLSCLTLALGNNNFIYNLQSGFHGEKGSNYEVKETLIVNIFELQRALDAADYEKQI